ncbi:hypothetical protein BDW59DRAFT_168222 [Aspergillus cavernicola]|uniref:Uncharacterized protein n=1 Tax=Aspergillus cavernicola TaxID=176166 RepID=A0ABR4H2D2_9EURO
MELSPRLTYIEKLFHYLQFAFGLAVVGLYSQDLNKGKHENKDLPAKWVIFDSQLVVEKMLESID